MFTVMLEKQSGIYYWASDTKLIVSQSPLSWVLHEAKSFVDDNRTNEKPYAVYHIAYGFHKKIWPSHQ